MSEFNEAEFLARRNIKENIYNLAQFENINTTFPETEAIIDSGKSVDADPTDVKIIIGLKRGWQKVLDSTDKTIDVNFIKLINKTIGEDLVLNAGEFRTQPIGVGGVDFKIPPIDEKEYEQTIKEINSIKNPKTRAIEFLIYNITSQPFMDGNKRTSFMVANQILVKNNVGVIFPNKTAQQALDFSRALNNFYNNPSQANHAVLVKALDEEIELTDSFKQQEENEPSND